MWLDDQSKAVVAFKCEVQEGNYGYASYKISGIPAEVESIAAFCKANYPVDDVKLVADTIDESWGNYNLTLVKNENGQEKTQTISIRMWGNWLFFNS